MVAFDRAKRISIVLTKGKIGFFVHLRPTNVVVFSRLSIRYVDSGWAQLVNTCTWGLYYPKLVKTGNYFLLSWIILRYRLIFVGFVVFLSDIVVPRKCTFGS